MNTVCSELEVDENNFDLSEEIKEEQKVTEESSNEGTMSENQILQSLAAIQEELGLKGTEKYTFNDFSMAQNFSAIVQNKIWCNVFRQSCKPCNRRERAVVSTILFPCI